MAESNRFYQKLRGRAEVILVTKSTLLNKIFDFLLLKAKDLTGLTSSNKNMKEKITGVVKIKSEHFEELKKRIKDIPDFKKNLADVLAKSTTELLEVVLGGVINLEASDIHIEPVKEKAKLRIRIDGVLQDILFFEEKIYLSLLSRIKILSGLKLNIAKSPQDGRFSILTSEQIEVRTSTLPAEYGESIVLRILNPKALIELEQLGLKKNLLEIFKKEIRKPNGMIIVTGPTGSGKTTTLYAFLKKIQRPEIKIITIEDPIEYHLKEISQSQVNVEAGYNFANGLQSIMRQDPDVILVGEIRDSDTAKIALQAALTGHLVLTTLHTNDAIGTIPRLINLDAKAATVGAALNMVVAQRLVRKVCQKCVKFEKAFIPKTGEELKVPKAQGCKFCNFTGYRGRIGIFEAFLLDQDIQKLIVRKAPIFEIKKAAMEKGMITMYQTGLRNVILGITTLEEIKRVIGE